MTRTVNMKGSDRTGDAIAGAIIRVFLVGAVTMTADMPDGIAAEELPDPCAPEWELTLRGCWSGWSK
jgi:hypothetical protein